MSAPSIYIGAQKETLIEVLEAALREIRESVEGSISVPIYANPKDGTVTFTDEDCGEDSLGWITIEIEG